MNESVSAQDPTRNITIIESQAYYWVANQALRLEQAKEYAKAAKIWANANKISCNRLNQHWSEKRAEFCLKQKERSSLLGS
jgi:hypothetical protein